MYRIHFVNGKFVVQTLVWHLFWEAAGDDLVFDTYMDAKRHVSEIGLDQLYKDKSANQFHDYIMGR